MTPEDATAWALARLSTALCHHYDRVPTRAFSKATGRCAGSGAMAVPDRKSGGGTGVPDTRATAWPPIRVVRGSADPGRRVTMTVAEPMSPSLVAASRRSLSELKGSQAILTAASAERWAKSAVSAWTARAWLRTREREPFVDDFGRRFACRCHDQCL